MSKFNKFASVLTSAIMLGSTVGMAAAANYPSPFIQGGSPDVGIVYGSNVAITSTDLVAATNIMANLNTHVTSSDDGSTIEGGDSVLLSKSGDPINLGNVVSTVFGTSVTDDDMQVLLADGTYTNDENSDYDYEQRITLGTSLIYQYFSDSDHNDRMPSLGFNLTSGQLLLNYSLDFTTDAASDVSGGDLVDFETTTINLFGREYYISDFDNSTLDITLLDTANSAIVEEGETETINVGDTSYDVSITFIDSSEVILSVNGAETNSLSEGETYKLADGSFLGVKDILYNSKDTGISKVEFSIGSGKLELRNGQSIKINDDTVNEVTAEVRRGSASGGKEQIDRINFAWTSDDDAFITPETDLIMPGFETLKYSMGEIVRPEEEITTLENDGSTTMQLVTELKDGPVTIPFLYANATGTFVGIGKDSSNRLVTSNNTLGINAPGLTAMYNHSLGDRRFIASWNSSTSSESYYMKLDDFVNENGVNKTTFYKYSDGQWVEVCEEKRLGDSCSVGSLTITITGFSNHPDRAVNLTLGSGGSFNKLFTKQGLMTYLPYNSTSGAVGSINLSIAGVAGHAGNGTVGSASPQGNYRLTFMEENRNDNVASGNQFNFTIDPNSDNEVEVISFEGEHQEITDPDDNNKLTGYVYSDLATMLQRTGASSDQREGTLSYAGGESYAELFLTDSTAIVSGGGGDGTTVMAPIMDSEVSQASGKNLIVVGGSCVNTVAADLLGSTTGPLCGSDFTAKTGVGSGQFLIETFSRSGGKVATLVAGYSAGDTSNAATFLRTQTVDTSVGKKYTGTSATSASLVTA